MGTPTYTLISETVLGSAQASVTFSSIPGTYKDLVLECVTTQSGAVNTWIQFNGDTATNYSGTNIRGNGTTASSSRRTNENAILVDFVVNTATTPSARIAHILSYGNANVYKTALIRTSNATDEVYQNVALWRSTAAITSLTFYPGSPNTWSSGSTFRLWGIVG